MQDYSIKYMLPVAKGAAAAQLQKVFCDRNGVIQVCSSEGLLRLSGGQFLYPGKLVTDLSYRPFRYKKISDIALLDSQFVYLDDKSVFSNAWAGKLFSRHALPDARLLSPGAGRSFLVSDGAALQYIVDTTIAWTGRSDEKIADIRYDAARNVFWLLGEHSLSVFSPATGSMIVRIKADGMTCFTLAENNKIIIAGTHNGYFRADAETGQRLGNLNDNLPCDDLSFVDEIEGKIWFGSVHGAFMLREDGKFDYFASQRWIPSDHVIHISRGRNSILILTDLGLGEIHFEEMTLAGKAAYYERQVRARHIRHGFNATISRMKDGDPSTGILEDSDNDGLWTSMYLGAEVFRYAATHSPEALQNCRESMDAMERLYSINPVPGFPARSFERRGYKYSDEAWRRADNPEWDWKSTTSSDEAIGHIFVFGAMAELVDDPNLKSRAIRLIDTLMGHIVKHRLYMVDWNGKPTTWGRWNPEYTNARPKNVGDRKITSSNIMAMLQTAYHFTHKEIYKQTALDLLQKHGYLDNLMRPMKEIGYAPAGSDELSRELSDGWNHSDDEMYFLGYWGLYRYALNDTLKRKFRDAIVDHWEIERPEKEGAWDLFTAMTGVKQFDLDEAAWYLQKYPLDLINWKVKNSGRKDITYIPANFRRQTITEVLPPDELDISRHNSNRFDLDGGNGHEEYSAGDIWLLPYWLGRYLKVIGAPAKKDLAPAKKEAVVENLLSPDPAASLAVPQDFSFRIASVEKAAGATYRDQPYQQDYSIKYLLTDSNLVLHNIAFDRNGNIQVLSSGGLMKPRAGQLLVPGELVGDLSYLPLTEKHVTALGVYERQFVYADAKAVLSNAWAGKLYTLHGLPGVRRVVAGKRFDFLLTDGQALVLIRDSVKAWSGDAGAPVVDIQYDATKNLFWILTAHSLCSFDPGGKADRGSKKIVTVYRSGESGDGSAFTCFAALPSRMLLGTANGYLELNPADFKKPGILHRKLPATSLSVIREIGGHLWFGSDKGAFKQREDGGFDYYSSERWLPGDRVLDITAGENTDVWVLTDKGLAKITNAPLTLYEKAMYYETIIRERHIRYGFYADYANMSQGDVATSEMVPHDSDNLWTAMYMGAELFRYLVTHDPGARQNCIESFEAMERLHNIHHIHGLFGRSFERANAVTIRSAHHENIKAYWYPGYVNTVSWQAVGDGEWDWQAESSSDQADGQYFALTLMAQYMDDKGLRDRAVELIDRLTGYIVDHDLTLIDWDGRPTLWGIWNPYYVNRMPKMVGDRKLYSSNIISYLQTAYHFTGKKKYKDCAMDLLHKQGYLSNLTMPVSKIAQVPDTADAWVRELSGGWNYSDNEMYFLPYWGLTPYAFNDSLKRQYSEAIRDHWDGERGLNDALWNFMYARLTGAKEFDLKGSIWELQEMPMDMITWNIRNSGRKDITLLPKNFKDHFTKEVLPPDERPENKHNRNLYDLDSNGRGESELGGGDTYLLPYWLGRYMGVISAPAGH